MIAELFRQLASKSGSFDTSYGVLASFPGDTRLQIRDSEIGKKLRSGRRCPYGVFSQSELIEILPCAAHGDQLSTATPITKRTA